MANDTQDKLNAAKATLADANKKFPSPAPAAAPVSTKAAGIMPRPASPTSGLGDGGAQLGKELKAKQDNVNAVAPVIGQFKDGGKVKKTGNYKLHEGETVLTAEQGKKKAAKAENGMEAMAAKAKSGKSKHRMHIESTDNDGYITKHSSEDGEGKSDGREQVHVHPDMDALVNHVKSTFGQTGGEPTEATESDNAAGNPSAAA